MCDASAACHVARISLSREFSRSGPTRPPCLPGTTTEVADVGPYSAMIPTARSNKRRQRRRCHHSIRPATETHPHQAHRDRHDTTSLLGEDLSRAVACRLSPTTPAASQSPRREKTTSAPAARAEAGPAEAPFRLNTARRSVRRWRRYRRSTSGIVAQQTSRYVVATRSCSPDLQSERRWPNSL